MRDGHARCVGQARLLTPAAEVAASAGNVIGGAEDEQASSGTVLHGQDDRGGKTQTAYLRDGQA